MYCPKEKKGDFLKSPRAVDLQKSHKEKKILGEPAYRLFVKYVIILFMRTFPEETPPRSTARTTRVPASQFLLVLGFVIGKL